MTKIVRRVAVALVERERIRVGSRMVAYENIGSMIGASGWWVRSFINGYGDERRDIPLSNAVNLWVLYERLCERVELDNHEQALRLSALRKEIYEAAPRALAEVAAIARGEAAETPASIDPEEET